MKFDTPLSGGLLIVGSLLWDEHETRVSLREEILNMEKKVIAPAPIRYGRKSEKRQTYTMVLSPSCKDVDRIGKGVLVPFTNNVNNTTELIDVASKIIVAEHKGPVTFTRFNWGWGCLAFLPNPDRTENNSIKQLKEYWAEKISDGFNTSAYIIDDEQQLLTVHGELLIDWEKEYGDLDFLVITATKPTRPSPSILLLAEAFTRDATYFVGNRKEGIQTYLDNKIQELLNRNIEPKQFYKAEIPFGWQVIELGQLFEFKNGINAGKESYGKGVKFINVMEVIYHDFVCPEMIPGTVQVSDEQKELYLVKDGDVLFNRTSETIDEIGLSAVFEGSEDVVFGGFVIRGRPITNIIDKVFKRYCFRSSLVRNQIIVGGQGAVRTNIGQGDLAKVKIPLPPLPEQKAIANILSTVDTIILTTEKLIAKKELSQKWLMQKLLTGRKRLKGFDSDWRDIHLGEMFTERNETKFYDLTLLSIGQNGVYPQDESIKKDTSNDDKTKYKRICPGDIGYNTMRMWQGRSALSKLEGIVSPAYTVVTPKKNANSLFFSYLFKTPKIMNLFWRNSQGLVDDTLNCKFKDFSIVKIHLPQTKEEQIAIAQVLQVADEEIKLLKAKTLKLREQKKWLMQVLLTGKKRLKVNE